MANVINIGGGAGGSSGGGHTILDNGGTSLTQRAELQFKGAYSEDNSTDEVTEVNVVRSMTKAEFDLLSADEKQGVINVTDVTGGGENEFQPIIYSEEEREIGVWVDGKPLYEKTLVTNTPTAVSNNAWAVIPWENEPANIDKLVNVELTGVTPNVWYQVRFSYENSHICCAAETSSNFPESSVDTYVVARYTKTTDQAGSGTWTPQGLPAVHYSTDERVVGTWIDGSTLYEKTLEVNTFTYGGSNWNEITHNISNFGTCVECVGQIVNTQDSRQYSIPTVRVAGNGTGVTIGVDSTKIYYINNWIQNATGSITIRYTKTST